MKSPKAGTVGIFPIVIVMAPELIIELQACSEGSYDDMLVLRERGQTIERPLLSHAHAVAKRYTRKLVIETAAEAEDLYYEVCSGTLQLKGMRGWNAANKIADALRAQVRSTYPVTVNQWPRPYDETGKDEPSPQPRAKAPVVYTGRCACGIKGALFTFCSKCGKSFL